MRRRIGQLASLFLLAACATTASRPVARLRPPPDARALVGQYLALRVRLTNEVPWVVVCTPGWEVLPEDTLVRWGTRVVAKRMTADTLCRSPAEARADTSLKVLLVRYDLATDTQRIEAVHRQEYWPRSHRETFLHPRLGGTMDLRFWYFAPVDSD